MASSSPGSSRRAVIREPARHHEGKLGVVKTMDDPMQQAVWAKLQARLNQMSPEDRKRALEAGKARLELIRQAREAGLPVDSAEQITQSLKRLAERARKSV